MSETFTHTELLLAKEVMGAAHQLRRSETPRHLLASDDSATTAELADWHKSHPIEGHYRRVLESYVDSAKMIRSILSSQ